MVIKIGYFDNWKQASVDNTWKKVSNVKRDFCSHCNRITEYIKIKGSYANTEQYAYIQCVECGENPSSGEHEPTEDILEKLDSNIW